MPVPGSTSKQTMAQVLGKVCRMCDRKFILYSNYSEYATQIEKQDQLIKQGSIQNNQLDTDLQFKKERLT
jgi:hypothetical protein